MKIKANFISNWDEGRIETDCQLDLDTGKISDIITSNEGVEFESLINEEISVVLSSGETKCFEALCDDETNEYRISEGDFLILRYEEGLAPAPV